jgi:predicted double-glycine peptidase
MLWAQLLAIAPLACLGACIGIRLGKSRGWWLVFVGSLVWVGMVIIGHRAPRYALEVPVSWAVDITNGPPLLAFVIPLMFASLVPQLPKSRRGFVTIVTSIMVINFCLLPAACPLLARPALAASITKFDAHGVCLQTHGFSCGPSATVTCLRALGVAGDEGPLSIAACCGPLVGTDSRYLAQTINREFGALGITAECQYADSLQHLQTPAVANMQMPLIGGHFVAVLKVEPDYVTVGDPYNGFMRIKTRDFESAWTHIAIPIHRKNAADRSTGVPPVSPTVSASDAP